MAKKETPDRPDLHRISDIDQVKALANPLRMRIVETLAASDPMTTKQVAEALGEKPTRLYHHVDLLQKAGLIRLTHTRQNRGATEKYYEAIARSFRAGSELFSDDDAKQQAHALRPMIHTIFDTTTAELLRLLDSQQSEQLIEDEGVLSYVEMHLTQAQVNEVHKKLKDMLDYLQGLDDPPPGAKEENLRKFRLTLAHYPLDRFE